MRLGQHVHFMLGRFVDFFQQSSASGVWQMKFDDANGKLPQFCPSEGDVQVLPLGLA